MKGLEPIELPYALYWWMQVPAHHHDIPTHIEPWAVKHVGRLKDVQDVWAVLHQRFDVRHWEVWDACAIPEGEDVQGETDRVARARLVRELIRHMRCLQVGERLTRDVAPKGWESVG